jgi:hypothetical protein
MVDERPFVPEVDDAARARLAAAFDELVFCCINSVPGG